MSKSDRTAVAALVVITLCASQGTALAVDCFNLPSGLVSHWPADGTAADLAGVNPGTLVNGTTFAPGIAGLAFSFDGVDDYVDIADHPTLDLSSGEFTISVWVNPDVCPSAGLDNASLVLKESSTAFDAYNLVLFQGKFGFVESANASSFVTSAIAGTCVTGVWHHVAATQSAGVAILYVNGAVAVTDNTAGIPLNTNLPLRFGLREDVFSQAGLQPKFFDGLLDEVMLFDRALTLGEIQDIFKTGSSGSCAIPAVSEWGLVALVLLALATGTIVFRQPSPRPA